MRIVPLGIGLIVELGPVDGLHAGGGGRRVNSVKLVIGNWHWSVGVELERGGGMAVKGHVVFSYVSQTRATITIYICCGNNNNKFITRALSQVLE